MSPDLARLGMCSCRCPIRACFDGTETCSKSRWVLRRRLGSGDCITSNTTETYGLRIVISGIVKVFDYTRNGEQFIHKFVYPGEFLKLQPWAEIPKCTTIALTDVKICDIAYQWHRQAEAPFPGIDRVLLASAIWENNHAELWQRILVLRKPLDRVIYFLLDIAERSGIYCDRECLIELPMTRSDVADYLGLKRETVSRAFSQLRDEGYISVLNRQTHAIRNIRRLANLVDSEIVTSSVNPQQSGRIDAPRQYDA